MDPIGIVHHSNLLYLDIMFVICFCYYITVNYCNCLVQYNINNNYAPETMQIPYIVI